MAALQFDLEGVHDGAPAGNEVHRLRQTQWDGDSHGTQWDSGSRDGAHWRGAGSPAAEVPPADPDRAAAYHARRPGPNYEEFTPVFSDMHGRQYGVMRRDAEGDAQPTADELVASGAPAAGGRVRLSLRMPINQRWSVPLPAPSDEKLVLYHPASQTTCSARTDGVFVAGARARTGFVVVRDFVTHGQVADPAVHEPALRTGRPAGAEYF